MQLSYTNFNSTLSQDQLSMERALTRFGPNQMMYDLGIDIDLTTSNEEIRTEIEKLDRLFHIVLIAEHLDESLILMKELFCWDFQDIVFFDKNVRKTNYVFPLTLDQIETLNTINHADVQLYEHFLDKHKEAVLDFGADEMEYQVNVLKYYKEAVFTTCGIRYEYNFDVDSLFKEYSDKVISYVPDCETCEDDCTLLSLPENTMLRLLRDKMRKLHSKDHVRDEA